MADKNSLLRIGLIGAGRIVERAHLPVLAKLPEVVLAGLFDPDLERAQVVANQFHIPHVCRTLEELFGLGLDVALVACPNAQHASVSMAALEAHLHVLCEKPMALNSTEAQAMSLTAERTGRELMIAFANRFRPEIVVLQQMIQAGVLGEVTAIRCGWLRRKGVPGVGTWFTRRELAGGGVLTDLGSHLIDLALWLSGRPTVLTTIGVFDRTLESTGQASWYLPGAPVETSWDVEVSATGFIVCHGPLTIFVEVSWDCGVPYDQTYLYVRGKQGLARIKTLFGFSPSGYRPEYPLRVWQDDHPVAVSATSATDLLQPYQAQWKFFIDSLRTGRSLRSELQDSVATVQVIEALYRSGGG
jgi:predicted dehydrogenase